MSLRVGLGVRLLEDEGSGGIELEAAVPEPSIGSRCVFTIVFRGNEAGALWLAPPVVTLSVEGRLLELNENSTSCGEIGACCCAGSLFKLTSGTRGLSPRSCEGFRGKLGLSAGLCGTLEGFGGSPGSHCGFSGRSFENEALRRTLGSALFSVVPPQF